MSRTELRGYQAEAVKAVAAGFKAGDRGQVHAACGTGKTMMAVHAARKVCPAGGLVVVACPSLALLAQTAAVWAGEHPRDRILAVCGDPTVGDAPVRPGDLPCPVTRDPAKIAAWVAQPSRTRRLIATTHLSADMVGAGLKRAKVRADLLIVDEAHRTAGRASKHTSLLHRDKGLAADRRLYMTATPRYLAASKRGDDTLVGMDDERTFGPVLFSYPFGRAIKDGWLDDYQVAVIGVAQQEALETLRDVDEDVRLGAGDVPLRMAVVQTALARAMKQWGLRRVVAFTPRVEQARRFAETLPTTLRGIRGGRRLNVTSRYVHGGMSVAARDAVLDELRKPPNDGATVVANVRCLMEGVDVPAVDGVLFTHPISSMVDSIQAVGRALRRNPAGSGVATVIVPVLLPDSPDQEADMGDDGYATLWQVVKALRAHDETLGAALDRRRRALAGQAANHDPDLPARIVVRLPDGSQARDYLRHVSVRLVQQATSQWMESYAIAERYHTQYGHLHVPGKTRFGGMALGVWIRGQRAAYRAGTLASERVRLLEAIGMVWGAQDEAWYAALSAATQLQRERGHLMVDAPVRLNGIELYSWIKACRERYRAGTLAPERVAALNKLGMVWSVRDELWQARYEAARSFYREYGHLDVPAGTVADGMDLRAWLTHQRREHSAGTLSTNRVKALNEIGMVWSLREQQWLAGIGAATQYHQQHRHLKVPKGTYVNGVHLPNWLGQKRRQYRKGTLSRDRVRALDELGMVWNQEEGS